jgi:hypothetical protein
VDQGNDDDRDNPVTAHLLVSVSHPVPSLRFLFDGPEARHRRKLSDSASAQPSNYITLP